MEEAGAEFPIAMCVGSSRRSQVAYLLLATRGSVAWLSRTKFLGVLDGSNALGWAALGE